MMCGRARQDDRGWKSRQQENVTSAGDTETRRERDEGDRKLWLLFPTFALESRGNALCQAVRCWLESSAEEPHV